MQIPILSGIFTDTGADFRTSYPVNMIPVPKETGISSGYLRTAEGMVEFANSIYSGAADRGGINWNGACYRVIGEWLTRVNEDQTIDYLGQIDDDGKRVVMTYSFDRLAIAAAGKLYYWPISGGTSFVTDPDLGTVLDVVFASGYYITTDGEFISVTELNDPFAVNPLKYGSSEVSPDPVNSLLLIRNEVVAINRYTCETFQNVGGTGFPYQRVDGAMIPKGSIGTHASCYYLDTFAFVGSGPNEALSVYIGRSGGAEKIATREIEVMLQQYTEEQLASIVVESREDKAHQWLYLHLPDRTMVYDRAGSGAVGEPVWFRLTSGSAGDEPYAARNYVYAYGKWLFGDINSLRIGYFTNEDARQFGETVPAWFETMMVYNEGRGAIMHSLELVRLTGRSAGATFYPDPTGPSVVAMSYTDDGQLWSDERMSPLTYPGQTTKRTQWRRAGKLRHFRAFRFILRNNVYPDAFVRLEAVIEPLGA